MSPARCTRTRLRTRMGSQTLALAQTTVVGAWRVEANSVPVSLSYHTHDTSERGGMPSSSSDFLCGSVVQSVHYALHMASHHSYLPLSEPCSPPSLVVAKSPRGFLCDAASQLTWPSGRPRPVSDPIAGAYDCERRVYHRLTTVYLSILRKSRGA